MSVRYSQNDTGSTTSAEMRGQCRLNAACPTKPLLSSLVPSDGNVEICYSEILRSAHTERKEDSGGKCLSRVCVGATIITSLTLTAACALGPAVQGRI